MRTRPGSSRSNGIRRISRSGRCSTDSRGRSRDAGAPRVPLVGVGHRVRRGDQCERRLPNRLDGRDAWRRCACAAGATGHRRAGSCGDPARPRSWHLPCGPTRRATGRATGPVHLDGRIPLLEADHQEGARPDRRHHAAEGRAAGITADRRAIHQVGRSARRRGHAGADPLFGRRLVIDRLIAMSQELAGTLTAQLAPGRLSVMLLDVDTNGLLVAYHNGPRPATTDEPLLQLALRRGPLVFPDKVVARAAELDVTVHGPAPASWLGVPIVAVSRTIGAVAMEGVRKDALDDNALLFTRAVLAQAGIALENARLVELLSSGKREWERTVDAFNQAICYVDSQGAVRRANRVFAELIKLPVTALPGRPWLTLLPPAWIEPVARLLAASSTEASAPLEVRAGDRILLVTAIPSGEPGAAVLLFEDQTEK